MLSAVGLKENPQLKSSGLHFPVMWDRMIVTAYPFLVPKRTVTDTRGGVGSQKDLAALSSEPQVKARPAGTSV